MGGKFSTGNGGAPPQGGTGTSSANGGRVPLERAAISPGQGAPSRYRPLSQQLAIVPTVSVVIPAKNEAQNLPIVLGSLPDWVDEVVLVDGHSVDQTIAVARQCRPDIKVVTQPGEGKGNALLTGFKACTSDIVVMMDGDGSTPGTEIVRFVAALVAGADFAKGSRFANSGGSDDITVGRRLGNRILSGLVNLTFGTRYTDLCYGYNAFWSKHLSDLYLDCGGFEIETVMNIRAAKAALRVQEVPSRERPRVHGKSNLHVVADGWRILKAITVEASPRSHPQPPEEGDFPPPVAAAMTEAEAVLHPTHGGIDWERTVTQDLIDLTGGGAAPARDGCVPDEFAVPGEVVGTRSDGSPSSVAPQAQLEDRTTPAAARRAVDASRGMVSVVICAYTNERWDDTRAAVQSVKDQSFANREIILVVDHNPALYSSFAAALPDITVTENREERGLSGGKNTGLGVARGDVVAFLDDDAVAEQDWLKFLVHSYEDPAVVGVGGLTLPLWEEPRPSWFPKEFDWVVGCTYRGMAESRGPVRNLLGGNASFRRHTLERVGGFQNGIGRSSGRRPLGCEETELCIRVSQQLPGSVFLFDDRAIIWHRIPAGRSRFSYFRSRCYAEGLSKAQVTANVGTRDGLSTERRYATRTLPTGIVQGVTDVMHGDASGLERTGAITVGLCSTAAGYVAGSLRRTKKRAPDDGEREAAGADQVHQHPR
jgi:glucosyl-dolichyl phosphate glucuronosyltransferase